MTCNDRELRGLVSDVIAERLGLHYSEERWPDLARGLEAAGKELGLGSLAATLNWVAARRLTSQHLASLADHLTVGETYFFRDPASFAVLEQQLLPRLIAERSRTVRSLRLWSAGCCSGEEAYSLAITCARLLPDIDSWSVSILATDINPRFLAKAEAGVYSEWSFRGVPAWLRERYFAAMPDKKLRLDPAIRKMVTLASLNLAEDAYPSMRSQTQAMDVILCRNVLMYFSPEVQRRVIARLHACLVQGGVLLINPAEGIPELRELFELESDSQASLYRKGALPPAAVRLPEDLSVEAPLMPPLEEPTALAAVALARQESAQAPVPSTPGPAGSPPEDSLALARSYADQGRLAEALEACARAIAGQRTDGTAHLLQARILRELGRLDDAIAAFGRVLYLDQDCVPAHHALGGLYKAVGDGRRARRHLALALKLLAGRSLEEILPETDGMTCGRLLESVRIMMGA